MKKTLILSVKFLKNNVIMSMFVVALMTFSLIVFINAIGRLQYVNYTLEVYKSSGLDNSDYFMPNYFNPGFGSLRGNERNAIIEDMHDKISRIPGVADIVFEKTIDCLLSDFKKNSSISMSIINSEFLESIRLDISDGVWITDSKETDDRDVIDAVVGGTDLGYMYQVGDIVDVGIKNVSNSELIGSVKVRVIGILQQPSYSVSFNSASTKMHTSSLLNIDNVFIIEDNEKVEAILSNQTETPYKLSANSFIMYESDVSSSRRKEIETEIMKYGSICTHEQLIKNSAELNRRQLMQTLPFSMFMLVVSTLSFLSVATVTIYKRMKDYVIFYICGASWKSCFKYAAIAIGALALLSLGMVGGYIKSIEIIRQYVDGTYMTSQMEAVIFNSATYAAAAVYLIITTGISLLIPYLIFKKDTPIEIYRGLKK